MEIYPLNFLDTYAIEGHLIKYSSFIEICQGGPEVARLSIDGRFLGAERDIYFGGPPVFYKGYMFVPHLKKSFLSRYFKLCVIDLNNLSMKEIGGKEELILLKEVNDNTIYFFRESPNLRLRSINWKWRWSCCWYILTRNYEPAIKITISRDQLIWLDCSLNSSPYAFL